jgi:pyrimidine deaminase RibD-like protein
MLSVADIFEHLFRIAAGSRDPEGVVAACMVRGGTILSAKASSDDGQHHAEYLVLQDLADQGMRIALGDILYTTLEPCSDSAAINDGRDCTSCLLDAGIRKIVYAARDPEYSTTAARRLRAAQVRYVQVDDRSIVERAGELFNATLATDLSEMKLPRRGKL